MSKERPMVLKKIFSLLTVTIFLSSATFAQYFSANDRLHHVTTSQLKRQGNYDMSILTDNSMLFGKQIGTNKSGNFLTQNFALFDMSLVDYVQLSVGFNLFESAIYSNKTKFAAGPVFLSFKVGNMTLYDNSLDIGLLFSGSLYLSSMRNVPFYPYHAPGLQTSLMLYGSYFLDGYRRKQSESFHANLAFRNYGDQAVEISGNATSFLTTGRTVGLYYGLGYQLPSGKWTYGVETWGELYVRNPAEIIYSRESYLYITGIVKYNLYWMELEGAVDLLALGYGNTTNYTQGALNGYPQVLSDNMNYAPYMISLGVNFNLSAKVADWLGERIPVYFYETTAPEEYTEDLRKEDVITLIENKYYADLYECYRDVRRFDNNIKGTVYFDFTIKEDGTVDKAKVIISTFDSQYTEQTERCMVERMKFWTFPVGKSPLRFEILPLTFGGA